MNNEEAKFILHGYRPNGVDAEDATFCAALEQAKTDLVLREWFAKQQAFDAAISAKLASISPPANLRAAILAGGRLAQPQRRHWWNQPALMAMAAGLAILLAAGLALWPKQAEAFTTFALADARESEAHGGMGGPIDSLQSILSEPTTKLGQKLPVDFALLRNSGCRTVKYQGRDVLEVCFSRNGVWFHCYIARAEDFPRVARSSAPVLVDKEKACIASWTDAGHLIVVVSKAGRKSLEALL
jgi:hypothetical protein